VYASYMQKLSTGVLQSSMYNLKPLKRINTNARLSIKIEFKKAGRNVHRVQKKRRHCTFADVFVEC